MLMTLLNLTFLFIVCFLGMVVCFTFTMFASVWLFGKIYDLFFKD